MFSPFRLDNTNNAVHAAGCTDLTKSCTSAAGLFLQVHFASADYSLHQNIDPYSTVLAFNNVSQ